MKPKRYTLRTIGKLTEEGNDGPRNNGIPETRGKKLQSEKQEIMES